MKKCPRNKQANACLPVSSSTGIVRPPRVMLLMYSALRVLRTGMVLREDNDEGFVESARAKYRLRRVNGDEDGGSAREGVRT